MGEHSRMFVQRSVRYLTAAAIKRRSPNIEYLELLADTVGGAMASRQIAALKPGSRNSLSAEVPPQVWRQP